MLDPIATVRAQTRGALMACGAFSCILNLLVLAAPLYMLQIYDRILPAQGVETLIVLSILLAAAFLLSGFLDYTRAALFGRIALRFDRHVAPIAFNRALSAYRVGKGSSGAEAATALQDVRTLRRFLTGPAPAVVFDAVWVPIFLITILLIHPLLALVLVLGGALLVFLALANQRANSRALLNVESASQASDQMVALYSRNIEAADAMGMGRSLQQRWGSVYARAMHAARESTDSLGGYTAATRALRMALQSALLGVGAYLAIIQQISPGMIIAASILGGRALAPIDQAVAQWPSFVSSRAAYDKLRRILGAAPQADTGAVPVPAGQGAVSVSELKVSVDTGGQEHEILRNVSFDLEPGDILAVIGPSAGGKSTLARTLVGAWRPSAGSARLDGAEVHHLSPDDRGRQIGYLPQDVELFAGTVAENIARLELEPDVQAVVDAAAQAGAHQMILRLPDGYETQVGPGGAFLSGGQRQRIGLARALYRDPPLVVLDEPNANLDTAGDAALNDAILARQADGRTTVLITHRQAALAHVDYMLVISGGEQQVFGRKEDVLHTLAHMKKQEESRKVRALSASGGPA